MKLTLFLLAFAAFSTVSARFSGIYYDNGVDQTVIQKLLTRQEKREVEREILNLLGLPSRPRPRRTPNVDLGSSAPKFLLDIYKSLLDNPSSRAVRSKLTLSGRDQQAIDESDVIMSFLPQDKVEGMRHERGKRLWFDVSEVSTEDSIVDCELRVYQSLNYTNKGKEDSYTVTVYQVLSDKKGEHQLQFVDSVNTTHGNEGWLVFNMISPFSNWVAIPSVNLGIYISVTPHSNPRHELKPEDIGLVHSKRDEQHQPFMVAFFKSSGVKNAKVRQTREARRGKRKSENHSGRNPFLHSPHWSSRSCQMQNLYISFKDLDWQDWIIAPDGYEAFYCTGECNFPLNAHMNATNHAIVQTLVHLMNPVNVPKPCCAPTKLSAINVLYYVEESVVTIKKYKNMVVKSCGCH
ncbi:UNVERIFIED_CONTAM: hypothetical protein PYX00_006197 [Menopon gallinae]|uniref:TGF-beta family profile domain-containing protein n=1 Tax=Menopon gallinae TaxID=328185 RepID=A0AAW2HU69_9NEOP